MYDVIILGSGPAGLTAGLYTGRARLSTLIFESGMLGGNAALTDQIENYPGFPFGIPGIELMDNFCKQAERFGAEIRWEEVLKVESLPEGKKITTTEGKYWARAVIIAVGAKHRELNVKGEKELQGRGVSYCATCDGAFFRDMPVAVVGGGDSAVKEALFLAGMASRVYLIHRREEFRANQSILEKMLAHDKIELKLNKVVKGIKGSDSVKGLVLEDVISKEEESLAVEALFISVGMVPASDFLSGLVKLEDGYIITDEHMQTSVEGIFAAGDVRAGGTKQVATAVGDGAQAGVAVSQFLQG